MTKTALKTCFFTLLFLSAFYYSKTQQPTETYPKIAGYVGILHPIVTFSKNETVTNFKDYYTVGMPIGINIWKNKKIGFSAEFVPLIKADSTGSKMNNFLFHPGVLVALGHG